MALVVSCVHDSLVLDTPQFQVIQTIITVELVCLGVGHEE